MAPLAVWERAFFGTTAASPASRLPGVGSNLASYLDKHHEEQRRIPG